MELLLGDGRFGHGPRYNNFLVFCSLVPKTGLKMPSNGSKTGYNTPKPGPVTTHDGKLARHSSGQANLGLKGVDHGQLGYHLW